ncbi:unnamed protein product [Paramecium octaurelia]|uniref:Uncharacterized protein n=1 Tax=Paramecium octaurelia TaxID=43137 RepID=A0A8S1VQQ5_PAROT|nr:unnamed protein product [Paramecium octaurelia]
MGSGQSKTKKKAAQLKQPKIQNEELKRQPQYEDDVIDAANLAIAIQKEDLTTNIELFVHCEGLPKMDAFSLTDPVVVAYYEKDDKWVYIDRTEIIPESLNPKFVKTFIVNYIFERKQKLRFEIYDIDDFEAIDNLERQEFIGFVECEIRDIVCAPTQSISRTIINRKSNRKRNGLLHIRGAEYDMGGNTILFQIGCQQFTTKAEVLLRMSYFTDNKDWMPIHATEPIKYQKKQTVQFNDFYLPLSKFGNNEQAQIKLEVEEYNKTKGTTQLGECETTLQQLMENSGKTLRMTKNGLIVGQLKLIQVKQHSRYSFLNYIYSGAKIQVIVALDFTNSNQISNEEDGQPELSTSNDYISALKQILGILQYYNNENRYPVYGFGAKLPPYYNVVSHCFACTGNIFDPYVYGEVDEIINLYKEILQGVVLHGPTVFSQIISQAIEFAANEKVDQNNQKYYILLILTDGSINDMQSTIEQIYRAQEYPLSIIIVGIGKEDFNNMRILDGDDPQHKLRSKIHNDDIKRDLVQFVEFNSVRDNQDKLAKETLAEIPRQFLEYMEKNKIYPAKGKKNTKAATNDFIHSKIDEMKKLKKKEGVISGKIPQFLNQQKEEFIKQLVQLGYDRLAVTNVINNDGVPCKDVNLVIEILSQKQKQMQMQQPRDGHFLSKRSEMAQKLLANVSSSDSKITHRVFCIRQRNKIDELMQLKKQESKITATNFLFKLTEQTKPKPKPIMEQKKQIIESQNNYETTKIGQTKENLCLNCDQNKIELVFIPCGHACSCLQCYKNLQYCISCKQKVQMFAQIDYKS